MYINLSPIVHLLAHPTVYLLAHPTTCSLHNSTNPELHAHIEFYGIHTPWNSIAGYIPVPAGDLMSAGLCSGDELIAPCMARDDKLTMPKPGWKNKLSAIDFGTEESRHKCLSKSQLDHAISSEDYPWDRYTLILPTASSLTCTGMNTAFLKCIWGASQEF